MQAMGMPESMDACIRALVVDDEEPGRINLRYALAAYPRWQIVAECAGAAQARAALAATAVDVVFLDIRMPRESGLDLAREMVHKPAQGEEPPLIVFVTAYNAHAVEAFEMHALDYLLKPLDDARLAQAVERAERMLTLQQRAPYGAALRAWFDAGRAPEASPYWQQLSVRSIGRIETVRLEDVAWIGAAGNYVELHTGGRVILHRIPMSRLAEHLDPARFLRVHRGAFLRTDLLAGLEVIGDGSYEATLRNGERVPVSERYVQAVRDVMR